MPTDVIIPFTSASSLAAEIAAITPRNLTALNERIIFQPTGVWASPDGFANMNGFTTDSTRYAMLWPDANNMATGVWDDTKYRTVGFSSSSIILLNDPFNRIYRTQVENLGTGPVVNLNDDGNLVDSCIIRGRNIRSTAIGGETTYVRNTVITDGGQIVRGGVEQQTAGGVCICEYVSGGSTGGFSFFLASNGPIIAINCLAYKTGAPSFTDFSGASGFDVPPSSNNGASDASPPGPNSFPSIASNPFLSIPGGNLNLDVAIAESLGIDVGGIAISGVTVDFLGNPRPLSNTTLGAFQIPFGRVNTFFGHT